MQSQKLALSEKRRIMLRRRSPIVIRPRSILKKGRVFYYIQKGSIVLTAFGLQFKPIATVSGTLMPEFLCLCGLNMTGAEDYDFLANTQALKPLRLLKPVQQNTQRTCKLGAHSSHNSVV